MAFGIRLNGEAIATYFSLTAGRASGSPLGWSVDAEGALQFAREVDASRFRDTYLGPQAPVCTVGPIEERAV